MNCINMAMFFPGRKVWGCMVLWWHLPFCWGGIFIWMDLSCPFVWLVCLSASLFSAQSLSQPLWAVAVCGSKHLYGAVFVLFFQKIGQGAGDLKGCRKLLAKGRMHTCIRDAITYIEKTYGENQVEAKALSRIEQEYPLQQMATMHRFALQVEQNGENMGMLSY